MQMYAKLPMSPNAVNDNKSLFSFLRTLPEFVRRTPLLLSAGRAAIDRYLLPVGPTAAKPC